MSNLIPVEVDGLPEDIGLKGYDLVASTLKSKPGQWFIVAEDAYSSFPASVRTGKMTAFADGEYEVKGYQSYNSTTPSGAKTNRYRKVFARYLGPKQVAEEPRPQPTEPKPEPKPEPTPEVKPTAPSLTPMQRVALSIAKHHVDARKMVWMDLDEAERARRIEAAGVAYSTVYGLIADDMENTVKAKVRNLSRTSPVMNASR